MCPGSQGEPTWIHLNGVKGGREMNQRENVWLDMVCITTMMVKHDGHVGSSHGRVRARDTQRSEEATWSSQR